MAKCTLGGGRLSLRISLLLVLVIGLGGSACSEDGAPASAPAEAIGAASKAAGDAHAEQATGDHARQAASGPKVHAEGETAPRNPNERPIPAFEGQTLAGTRLSIRELLGQRILLFFFNPEVDNAAPVADAVQSISGESGQHNFRVVGVGIGSNRAALVRFAQAHSLDFPVLDDSSGAITQMLRLRSPLAALGMDAEGYMTFGIGGFATEGDIRAIAEENLRAQLRLPEQDAGNEGALFAYPQAPDLGVVAMSNGAVLETAELRGRAAIVIFFLHTCPHCHKALAAIRQTIDSIPADKQPRLVAISIQNAPGAIRNAMKELDLDFFDPYLDAGGQATDRWGVTGGVPVVSVLDAEGRIRHRTTGWNEKRDPGMLRMQVARAAGARVPMLLDPKGYSGNDVCGTCHEQEYATWQYTAHASAFDTLVAHGADRRTDCIGCHVVGFEEPGGYDALRQPAQLENVGCESCHGRGGPHLSPGFVPSGGYADVCVTCHNQKHSLGFDFATFEPRVSHSGIASLSNAERAKLLEGGPSRTLLPTTADYVGSDACQSCHPAEFATWEASPHGHAIESLEKDGQASKTECLECHTTAYGKPGGFVAATPVASQPDLARVGCESCHGPGGDHIGETARRTGTILSLGDKCDSCVILKVCGACHDDANDPGFEFKVEERIEAQRHGTIEAAATRSDDSAFHSEPGHRPGSHPDATESTLDAADHVLLQDAFERLASAARAAAGPS